MKRIRKRRENGCQGLPEGAKNPMVVYQIIQVDVATPRCLIQTLPNTTTDQTTIFSALKIGDCQI
jgi:hypothetical protein